VVLTGIRVERAVLTAQAGDDGHLVDEAFVAQGNGMIRNETSRSINDWGHSLAECAGLL
jgi:hypothetical protein